MNSSRQTYWVRLYAVEQTGFHSFVYGYAASARGEVSSWKMSNLPVSGSLWKLNQFNCFADEVEIQRLQQAMENGSIPITVGSQLLHLKSTRLVRRPYVIAIPHEALSEGRPKSFSDDMAEMESHWELEKRAPLDRAFPVSDFDPEAAQRLAIELLERLETETGIKFSNEDAGRLGNFDVFRHLSGDFRLPDGLCCRSLQIKSENTEQLSLLVWLESPMQNLPNVLVGCRLFNGGSPSSRTCILSEVRQYSHGEKMNFIPQEPFSQFEISAWSNRRLVGYKAFSIVREISFNMHVGGSTRRVRTKWSEDLPVELRDRAATVPTGAFQNSTVSSVTSDPWRKTEQVARLTARTGFSGKTIARYFGVTPKAQLESLEFVATLILRPNVRRVTIADPFFDDIGVESLLVKVAQTPHVLVLASHTSSSGGKARLVLSAEALRDELSKSVTIINIETPGEATQQFHDRYVMIEMDEDSGTESEVWMLSNSFSSMAKNYPLVVAMLPPDVAADVATYIRVLEQGKPPGKNHATRAIVWSKAPSVPNPLPVAPPASGFEDSNTILTLLADKQGLLSDWRVPGEALRAVIETLRSALEDDPPRRVPHLIALARWHYHGGPNASHYHFNQNELQWLAEAFRQLLASDRQQRIQVEIEAIQNNLEISDCLNRLWYSVNQIPFELRRSTNPALYFFADALWCGAPEILAEILDGTRSTSLFGWLCMEGSGATKAQIRSLLAASAEFIKALGVIFLHQNCERDKPSPEEGIEAVRTELMSSALLPLEAWLSLVFVETKSAILAKPNRKLFKQSAAVWFPEELSDDVLRRLTEMIGKAAPNRGVVLISRLADACPLKSWRMALHEWCVLQVLSELRLKKPIVAQPKIAIWCNGETILAVAHSVWKVHGDHSRNWFEQAVIKNLKLSDALEPLLRTRNYSEWSDALDSVMLGLWFGRAIAQMAPGIQREVEFATYTAPGMSVILLALGPEVWRSYVHKDEQLSRIVAFIGWSAEYCDESGLSVIERLLLSDYVPSVWRLWLIVQSSKLILKYSCIVEALTLSLSTGTSCNAEEVDKWGDCICKALNELEDQTFKQLLRRQNRRKLRDCRRIPGRFRAQIKAAQLRGNIHLVRIKLSQWQQGFHYSLKA